MNLEDMSIAQLRLLAIRQEEAGKEAVRIIEEKDAEIAQLKATLAAPQQHAQAANEDRQEEAHKLARILLGMVEGDGRVEGADIYADGYSAPDGDVYVLRAAELLVEQAAESKELTRYVETFALQANALKNAAAQPTTSGQ